MQNTFFIRLIVFAFATASSGAATLYVDSFAGLDAKGQGGSWAKPFKSIQFAVDSAKAGSTILVTNGVYSRFSSGNKKLTIKSVEGAAATMIRGVSHTIGSIVVRDESPLCDLAKHGRAKVMDWDPDVGKAVWTGLFDDEAMLGGTATKVEGFTLAEGANGAYGGTLAHCVITNLTQNAAWGASLSDCTIANNKNDCYWAWDGAGALVRGSTLNRCRVVDNEVVQGMWGCTLLNCLVVGNRQSWDLPVDETGTLLSSTTPDSFRGDIVEGGSLYNCTIVSNSVKRQELFRLTKVGSSSYGDIFEYKATGLFTNGSTIAAASCYNCIVYGNAVDTTGAPAGFARMDDKAVKTTVSSFDPLFRDPEGGDWRVLPWSPCRDAGADHLKKTGKFDIDGRPRKTGASVDIGAFEHPQGVPVPGNWDDDGVADPATYCADTFEWCILLSASGRVRVEAFGEKGAMPIPADWDGDGALDLACYTPAASKPAFRWRRSSDGAVDRIELGSKGATPLALRVAGAPAAIHAAWSGTSKKPMTVFADSSGLAPVVFGVKGAKAVAADFDHDGSSDLSFYTSSATRPSFSTLLASDGFSSKKLFPAGSPVALGTKGSLPAVADWDGDGQCDFGAYSGSAVKPMVFRIFSSSCWREVRSLPFGEKGCVAVPADWDGDGCAEPAIVRRGAEWFWTDGHYELHQFTF